MFADKKGFKIGVKISRKNFEDFYYDTYIKYGNSKDKFIKLGSKEIYEVGNTIVYMNGKWARVIKSKPNKNSNIIKSTEGILINSKYYTKEELEKIFKKYKI